MCPRYEGKPRMTNRDIRVAAGDVWRLGVAADSDGADPGEHSGVDAVLVWGAHTHANEVKLRAAQDARQDVTANIANTDLNNSIAHAPTISLCPHRYRVRTVVQPVLAWLSARPVSW
jgi:hypothetical protein